MSNLSRQLGILVVVCVFGLFVSDAQAGYVSFDSDISLALQSLDQHFSLESTSSSSAPVNEKRDEVPKLNFFAVPEMAMQFGPSGSGGMSSVSSSSGGNAPAAIVVSPESLTPSLITPLVIGDEPFSPRMLIAEIFRPPQV